MGFRVAHCRGFNAAVGQRLTDHCFLGISVWHREAAALAILVDRRAADQRQDMVAIRECVREALEKQRNGSCARIALVPPASAIRHSPVRRL